MQTQAMADKPPRYYQLNIQEDLLAGWTLVREWGQQGSPGRVKKDHFSTLEQAIQACISVRDAQVQRGYQIVFTHGQELNQ